MPIRLMSFGSRKTKPASAAVPRYSRSTDVLAASHGDRTVLMDLRREQYIALEGIGPDVWQLIEEPRTTGEIASRLAERFDAPEAEIERDVAEFLDGLAGDGLVKVTR